ncbi:MAG: Mrp/NBP35 family ATP-binding protein [Clostridiales bacterium]|nr:Mrp/NBP35 family ATP-binding protein [Clostridiales bacterium]
MSECTHDCSTCSSKDCKEKKDFKEKQNELSNVKKVIGIVSGKGGVGKSLVSGILSVLTKRKGFKTAILDADITGPSVPKMFGLTEKAQAMDDKFLLPAITKTGIEVMSINLLLENENDPVVWRGPVIAGAVKQFWTDVVWNEVDFMFVDMPPGTGDVPLTVFQSLPVDGIIIVTSPQELVSMIVGKAVKMANLMNIPVLGIVENMSYYKCPDCGKEISIFGESKIEETASEFGIKTVAKLPIDSKFAALSDGGNIEEFSGDYLDSVLEEIIKLK